MFSDGGYCLRAGVAPASGGNRSAAAAPARDGLPGAAGLGLPSAPKGSARRFVSGEG